MGRQQSRTKKLDQFGKGKVTPVQIAYIVDQYLSENHFTQTRTSFRSEASSLISKTPLQERPKGLMSLSTIIDEYVSLKEEKLVVEMEKKRMENERFRVQSLLQGMQNVMNAYNASSSSSVPFSASFSPALPPSGQHPNLNIVSSSGQMMNVSSGHPSFATQMVANSSSKKRQASTIATSAPTNAKKSCTRIPKTLQINGNCQHSDQRSSTSSKSNVEKLMINQTTATTIQTSPRTLTPPQSLSNNKNTSPVEHSSTTSSSNNRNMSPEFESNCTIVSTKTVIVSPYKQLNYYSVEKHCSSSCSPVKSELQRSVKRDHVKGRLDFDGVDEKMSLERVTMDESFSSELVDGDFGNFDLPVLDFDIGDLLSDFGIYPEDI